MESNLINLLGALFWIIVAPYMFFKPGKVITPINKIYKKFSRIATPLPPKDEFFEFRPQTATLTRLFAGIVFAISVIGFCLNVIEIIHR